LALGRVVGKVRQERRCVRPGRRKGAAARLPRRGKRGTPLRHARKSRAPELVRLLWHHFFYFSLWLTEEKEGKGREGKG